MEPLAVPYSVLRYILLGIDYQLSDRPVALDVWQKLQSGLVPRLLAVLEAAKIDERDTLVRAMNGAIKEWLRIQATVNL